MNISLVIPAYNEEKYIHDCLVSVFNQTEKPDEVIVVDNNSTDNTGQIAKTFPIILVKEKKQGMAYARNRGFNKATGDIIGRIDADTRLPKDWVKKAKEQFSHDQSLLGYSGPTIFKEKKFNTFFTLPEKILLTSFKKATKCDLLYGPNMIVRKSAWNQIKNTVCLQDKIFHEDVDLTIHLAQLPHAKTFFDKSFTVTASERRWKKAYSYVDYPLRYIRTLQHHMTYQKLKKRIQRYTNFNGI